MVFCQLQPERRIGGSGSKPYLNLLGGKETPSNVITKLIYSNTPLMDDVILDTAVVEAKSETLTRGAVWKEVFLPGGLEPIRGSAGR